MIVFVMISQAVLYVCFSILIGSFLLLLVPNHRRPDVTIPKWLLLTSTIAVPIFAFSPVLDVVLYMAPRLGLLESFKLVLTTFTVGTAWDFTLLGSIVLALLIIFAKNMAEKTFTSLGVLITLGLISTIAWSSHASGISSVTGIISDFIHLASVSIWVGILLIVGWCSNNHNHWLKFLSWFSIVAFSCLIATAISGLFLMNIIVDGYVDSWVIPYGQGLLMKHLFLIPLVFYAFLNGVIVKHKLSKDATFNPIPWIRVECIILLIIFTITAIYSQQAPPHGNYLTSDTVSPLFRIFQDDLIDTGSTIGFVLNSSTVLFSFLALLFITLNIVSFFKKGSIFVSFLFSFLCVTSIYVMMMSSIAIR